METGLLSRAPKTIDIPAEQLSSGDRLRYVPPEIIGRGYAALIVGSVEIGDRGMVAVKCTEGEVNVVTLSSDPALPFLPLDFLDHVDVPLALTFERGEMVSIEIKDDQP